MSTPTARSLAKLRAEGYIAAVVEKWVPASPAGYKGPIITRDVWNFGDILAAKIGVPGALLAQSTAGSNFSARLHKIRGIAEVGIWLASGNSVRLMCWRKVGAKGKRKLFECREMEITLETLGTMSAEASA